MYFIQFLLIVNMVYDVGSEYEICVCVHVNNTQWHKHKNKKKQQDFVRRKKSKMTLMNYISDQTLVVQK